jgi:cysteinyl-tRNA synthetase
MSPTEFAFVLASTAAALFAGYVLGRRGHRQLPGPTACTLAVPAEAAFEARNAPITPDPSLANFDREVQATQADRSSTLMSAGIVTPSEGSIADGVPEIGSPDVEKVPSRGRCLGQARSFAALLQDLDIAAAAESPFDVLVVDAAITDRAGRSLGSGDMRRLQKKADGARRLVFASIPIGLAECDQPYWRPEWARRPPDWLLAADPGCPSTHAVRYWHREWQSLLFGNAGSLVDRAIEAGFDGICLDSCDAAADVRRLAPGVAALRADLDGDMITFVEAIATHARQRQPDFLVLLQNGETLLGSPSIRAMVDAVVREDLLFGLEDADEANPPDEVAWVKGRLDKLRRTGKPVFVIEYLDDKAAIATAQKTIRDWGYLGYIADADRQLDRLHSPPLQA